MTKSTNWSWTQVCGFGSSVAGTGVPASTGPGSLCGQEYLTTTTSGPKVAGLPCLDMQRGGVSNRGNGGSCGYKFAVGAYDKTNDVIVIFGGQWNSSVRCEAVMYYPATNHWKNPLDTSCDGRHSPAARWTQAGTNIIDMGNGKMVMFGGTGNSTYNDTWILQTCSESNQSACSWTKLSPTTSPAADPDPVIDYSDSLGNVVYVDKQSPAHTWFFDPSTNQWADQTGTGSGGQYLNGPSLTTALNGGATPPYYSLGAIDQAHNTFVILNSCSTITTPSCGTFQTQIWTLSLPSTTPPVTLTTLTTLEALPYRFSHPLEFFGFTTKKQ